MQTILVADGLVRENPSADKARELQALFGELLGDLSADFIESAAFLRRGGASMSDQSHPGVERWRWEAPNCHCFNSLRAA